MYLSMYIYETKQMMAGSDLWKKILTYECSVFSLRIIG